jgi:hypothetical protein
VPVAVCPSVRPSSSLLLLQCCLLLVTSATSSTITSSARRSIDIIDCVVPTTSTVSSRQAGRSAGRQGSQVTTHSGAQVSRVHWRAVVQGDVPIHPHPLLSLTDPACSFHGKHALTDRTCRARGPAAIHYRMIHLLQIQIDM